MTLVPKAYNFSPGATILSTEVNTNFNDVYNLVNGKLTNDNIDDSASISYSKINLTGYLATIFNQLYPVGIVITLGVSTNPAVLFGYGTWTAITGKVIIGKAAAGTFNTLDGTGGAETVNLSHVHTVSRDGWGEGGSTPSSGRLLTTDPEGANQVAANGILSGTSGSATQSVLNPYIVKYIWQRTA